MINFVSRFITRKKHKRKINYSDPEKCKYCTQMNKCYENKSEINGKNNIVAQINWEVKIDVYFQDGKNA